jgi:cytoskeleton protein RodZ
MNEPQNPHFQTDLSVGEILRRTRLHYDQSLPDIERSLRIRASQLEALENGRYDQLPGRVYVIGFIRSYSEYLGLDGDKMVQLYKTQTGGKQSSSPSPQRNFAVQADDTKSPHAWHIAVSVVVALAVIVIWASMQSQDRKLVTDVPSVSESEKQVEQEEQAAVVPPAQQAPAPAEQPATSPENMTATAPAAGMPETTVQPPQPAPVANALHNESDAVGSEIENAIAGTATAPAAGETPTVAQTASAPTEPAPVAVPAASEKDGVILNIKKNSWVEIRGKDGKSIVSRVLKAGDRYFVPARPDLTISLGNAGGVELEVEGKKLKPLGADGEVKRNVPLDAASLKKTYGQ